MDLGEFQVGLVSIAGEDTGASKEVNEKVFTPGRLGTYWLVQVKAYLAIFIPWEFNWSQNLKMTSD